MLYCCLEAIRATEPTISIHVWPDRGTNESEICEKFGAAHHLTIEHNYHGNSFLMLEMLKWAYFQRYETIYVIEDDSIIKPDFFQWARKALLHPSQPFAACGWQYSPNAMTPSDGPDLLMTWYLSVASALPRRSLYGIIQHARPEYYADMGGYLDRTYPNSHRRGTRHYEQDGLVLRVCESESKQCIWPRRPRATHCGFHGYHMEGKPLEGTLEERVAVIKLALESPPVLQRLMAGGLPPSVSRCEDCNKPLLSEEKNAIIRCADCFHKEHPELPRVSSHYYHARPRC